MKQFLTNLCDFIRYMKYNRIWVTEKLQLASSYTWQLMRLIECHYQSLLSVCNNFWLRSNVDFGQMMRQKYVVSNILQELYVEDTQLELLWGVKKK